MICNCNYRYKYVGFALYIYQISIITCIIGLYSKPSNYSNTQFSITSMILLNNNLHKHLQKKNQKKTFNNNY